MRPAMPLRRTGASFTRPIMKRQRRPFVLCRWGLSLVLSVPTRANSHRSVRFTPLDCRHSPSPTADRQLEEDHIDFNGTPGATLPSALCRIHSPQGRPAFGRQPLQSTGWYDEQHILPAAVQSPGPRLSCSRAAYANAQDGCRPHGADGRQQLRTARCRHDD